MGREGLYLEDHEDQMSLHRGDQDQDLVNVLGTVTQPVAALWGQLCKISGCRSRVAVMSVLENITTDPKWSQNVIQSASESWVLGFGNQNSWL